jgi:mRNA interferase MazF
MKQGEIWKVDLNPVIGSEQAGNRPVVIISGNMLNKYLNVVIVCPLTTKVKNYKGNPVLSPNVNNRLTKTSEILIFQIRSISKERLKEKIGTIEPAEIEKIKTSLNDIMRY